MTEFYLYNNHQNDPTYQLHYYYQDDLTHQLLTAIGQLQYRAYNAAMNHLTFELYAEQPVLDNLMLEIVNYFPGDETWRKQRYAEVMAEHRLYIYGDFITLHQHSKPYIFIVVTHFSGQQINWQIHDHWIMRAPWLSAKLIQAYTGKL